MYKLFDPDTTYTFPSGRSVLGSDMIEEPEYSMISSGKYALHVVNGVMDSFAPLESLCERYGIDYDDSNLDTTISTVNDVVKTINSNTWKQFNTDKVTVASARVAQIMAMSFTDEQALEVKDIYPEYQVDHAYKQGDFFTHEGELYKVNQAHTSASQWEPGSVGTESLYTHLTLNEDGYPIWKQPTGAHDAYNKGDIVEYNGELYKSLIDGNSYSPDAYPAGWEKYTEPTE